MTKTLSSPLSPLVMRVSASRYVTSNSPLPVFDGGLNASGIRGSSNGGSCDKFPVAFTVVCWNIILMLDDPAYIQIQKHFQDTPCEPSSETAEKAAQSS